MIDRLVTIGNCAALMGISKSKAYRLAKAHQAPFEHVEKFGSTYLVPYIAFCQRLGLQPDPQAQVEAPAQDVDVLCAKDKTPITAVDILADKHGDEGVLRRLDSSTAHPQQGEEVLDE